MQLTCPSCGCSYAADQAGGLCPRCLAAMAVRTSDTPVEEMPVEPGETFHGLLVQKLVARGGMGIVFRARQPVSNRDVALKILPRSLAAEEEFRLRFDREARALAGLSHPNIVNLYDYGIDGGLMFLIMEFVEGVSLRQSLRDKKLSPARSLKIALEVCEALEFAHREGIIHRDIKPENVLLDRSGRIKLTDFGLAKRIDTDSAQLTQTHLAVGTPHYMAPEQLEQPKGIDHRVDIYSVGVLLYEMLTRELPIGRFPPPSSKEGVDERLDEIVYRCLEKDPDRRYQTVAELKAALASAAGRSHETPITGLLEERPTPARPRVASNAEVTCPCGWQFFVPAAARGIVHCPTCGEPMRLNLPTPATARFESQGPRAVPLGLRAPLKLLIAVGLLTVLVVVFLVLVLGTSSPRREPGSQDIAYKAPKAPVDFASEVKPVQPVVKVTPPVKPKVAVENPDFNAAEIRREIDEVASQANLAGIVSTVLLNSGRPQDHEQLQGRIRQFDGDIKDLILRLEEHGLAQESPERFRPGDKISSFAGKKIDPSRTLAFADELRAWLRAFRPGIAENITVTRSRKPVSFVMEFKERSPELVALAHQAGLVLGSTPGELRPGVEKAPPLAPFPVALTTETRKRLAALPEFYRTAMPYDDRGRAEALLLGGQGSREDTLFLTGRFSELLRKAEQEQRTFAARVKELEAGLADPGSVTDTVVCKDGRRIEGTILEETDDHVKIKSRFIAITLRSDEILRVEKGKGSSADFRKGYEASRGKKTELLKLLAMAKEKKLALQLELAATAVLVLDPGDERCRNEIGLPRSPYAAAAAPTEGDPNLAADRIEYRGRWYTPEQLRQELRSLGYVLVNGVWCEKIPKAFKIDNLYRDEVKLPVTFTGVSVLAQTHTEKDTVYDYRTKSWIPRTKLVGTARYIGGSGICLLEITAPGDIIDCRVHARSQVVRIGGFVSLSAVLDSRETGGKLLYTLAAPGENDGQHDVTEKVAGHKTFYLRADIRGDGLFLISDSNDLGVFEVKYSYGKPLDKINALFAARRDNADASPDAKSNNDFIESTCRSFALAAGQSSTLVDALSEMRKATEAMSYSRDFVMPSRFSDLADQLKDPLLPDWNGIPREQVQKLGTWWSLLPFEDRREFLAAYGVWCARTRYLHGPK
jgi:hypothetical protein